MPRRGYADTAEGQVFYVEDGEGEPLILLHQSPRSSSMYLPLLPLLAPHCRAIAVDLLGFGDSAPVPVHDGRADVVDVARNVVGVLDALGIERAHVFGFHTGAHMAAQVAANWPERVGSLIVVGLGFREDRREVASAFEAIARHGGVPRSSFDGSHVVSLWMRAYSDVQRNWLHTRNPPLDPDAPELLRAPAPYRPMYTLLTPAELRFIERGLIDALREKESNGHLAYEAMVNVDMKELLPRVRVPTLHADPDSPYESPFCRRGARIATLIPDCEVTTIAGADDNACELTPERVAEVIIEFLGRHPLAA